MQSLPAYLQRIGYTGPVAPTLDVLRAVHRAHLLSIPYENLDIHLGRALSLDIDAIFDKIVTRRRGGWCYEMNSLLAWALREIGFDVTLLAGTVGRERLGDLAEGNHLVLLVRLDQPYIADAGFGNGILEPLRLAEGEQVQEGFVFRMERNPPLLRPFDKLRAQDAEGKTTAERWVFHNHQHGGVGFDFTLEPHDMSDFAERCQWLQTSPDSGFTRVTTCHRWRDDGMSEGHCGIHVLRGATLQYITPSGVAERVIETEDDYRRVLAETFGLDLGDDVDRLWPKVWAAHLAWIESQA